MMEGLSGFGCQASHVVPVGDEFPLLPNDVGGLSRNPENEGVIVYDRDFRGSISSCTATRSESIELTRIPVRDDDALEVGLGDHLHPPLEPGSGFENDFQRPFVDYSDDSYHVNNDFSAPFKNDFDNDYHHDEFSGTDTSQNHDASLSTHQQQTRNSRQFAHRPLTEEPNANPDQQPLTHQHPHQQPQPRPHTQLTLHLLRNGATSTITLQDPQTQRPIYLIHDSERHTFSTDSRAHDLSISRTTPSTTPIATIRYGTTHVTVVDLANDTVQKIPNRKLDTFVTPLQKTTSTTTTTATGLGNDDDEKAGVRVGTWRWETKHQHHHHRPRWREDPESKGHYQLHISSPLLTMSLRPLTASAPASSLPPTSSTPTPLCTAKLYTVRPVGSIQINLSLPLSGITIPRSNPGMPSLSHQDWMQLDPLLVSTIVNLEYQRRALSYGEQRWYVTAALAAVFLVGYVVFFVGVLEGWWEDG